jgi:hypothetical protein
MRLFKRAKPAPQGSLRLGDHSENDSDYGVFTVSESRFPESFAQLWDQASDDERAAKRIRRWAVLTPITDPATKLVADLPAEIGGLRVSYLRPPHLTVLAKRITEENLETLEVPALVEWGPAGPTVLLIIDINARPEVH